eukprot:Nk52_evm24s24 gene=Nk52_evmTU24s24
MSAGLKSALSRSASYQSHVCSETQSHKSKADLMVELKSITESTDSLLSVESSYSSSSSDSEDCQGQSSSSSSSVISRRVKDSTQSLVHKSFSFPRAAEKKNRDVNRNSTGNNNQRRVRFADSDYGKKIAHYREFRKNEEPMACGASGAAAMASKYGSSRRGSNTSVDGEDVDLDLDLVGKYLNLQPTGKPEYVLNGTSGASSPYYSQPGDNSGSRNHNNGGFSWNSYLSPVSVKKYNGKPSTVLANSGNNNSISNSSSSYSSSPSYSSSSSYPSSRYITSTSTHCSPAGSHTVPSSRRSERNTLRTVTFGNFSPFKEHAYMVETLKKQHLCVCTLSGDSYPTVRGMVRVENIAFNKRVFVRITGDGWKTFSDAVQGHYTYSEGPQTDVFHFEFNVEDYFQMGAGTDVEFAVAYEVNGEVNWDNNSGKNFVCVINNVSIESSSSDVFYLNPHAASRTGHYNNWANRTLKSASSPSQSSPSSTFSVASNAAAKLDARRAASNSPSSPSSCTYYKNKQQQRHFYNGSNGMDDANDSSSSPTSSSTPSPAPSPPSSPLQQLGVDVKLNSESEMYEYDSNSRRWSSRYIKNLPHQPNYSIFSY